MKRISCFNILTAFLLFSLLLPFSTKAQEYVRKLNWATKDKTFTLYNGKTITQPTFAKAAHMQQYSLLPVYYETIPINGDGILEVQILNPVYIPCDHIDPAGGKYIKKDIEPKAQMTYYNKKPGAFVSFITIRKNPSTGALEKLSSFTLKFSFKHDKNNQERSSNNTYAANSVLANGTWFKLSVYAEGIYKIDYNFLKKALGVDPSTINLNTLAIFGNGGGMVPDLVSSPRPDDLTENPTMMVDVNGNGKFDNGDYLLFYAQMADAWYFDSAYQSFYHQKNLYSDNTYYFLTIDEGTGKRVPTIAASGNPNKTINVFDEHAYRDTDEYNPLGSGREWVGDEMTSFNNTTSFSYNFPNIITSSPIQINSYIGVNAPSYSTTSVSVNGTIILSQTDTGIPPSTEYPNVYDPIINDPIYNSTPGFYSATSSQINVTYTFAPSSDPSGTAACYIDWFELLFKRALTLSGNAMTFRSIASVGANSVSNFVLSNATANTLVWDITNIGSIQEMQSSLNGSTLSFVTPTNYLKEFIAFNSNAAFGNPAYIGPVSNQNLHGIGQPDMVIVTYDDFAAASDALAGFHHNHDNLNVSVVPLSQVYNEFASGKADISAIRDFMGMLYNRAGSDTTKMPKYLLLMGDGSYDPKGRISGSNNFVPCYESYDSYEPLSSYTSDDFYGLLDPGDGGDIGSLPAQGMDISVGRITADEESDAEGVVTKIINYKKATPGCTTCAMPSTNNSWRNVLTFLADYEFDGGTAFELNSDSLADSTYRAYPVYNYNKIYTDAYKLESTPAGDRFPAVNTAILNQINNGTLLINYVGHGGASNLSNARIFNYSDIAQLQNQYYPLFITATCEFSQYDLPVRSAGEELLINPKGGAIALLSTVRLVYLSSNTVIDNAVFAYMFAPYEGRYPTIGEVTRFSKNIAVPADPVNGRKYTLLGDPALTLDYPHYNIITTTVDNKPISGPHDTLKALTQITIKGQVTDNNNNPLNSFNGTIYPLVYDKISTLQTLNNDDLGNVITFQEYNSILFKGTASVTAGAFSFNFVVPKDINYQYGPGRISYYADNGSNLDAHGYTTAIVVGGSSDTAHLSTAGPKMSLYMDNESFVFGGITNNSPLLLVELQDPGGINTTGNGVGHNLTAVLDNNSQNSIILNDYYQSTLNDFTKGEIRYPFSGLSLGMHTVKVTAWDIYNNSSQAYTEFNVTNSAGLALDHVYNYPNPFTTHTQFMFEENMPCDEFTVTVQIYSVSGKLVKNIVQQVQSTGYRVDGIDWDGLDDYGNPIGKGVYIYKLSVHDLVNGNSAHKFEKLVLLR